MISTNSVLLLADQLMNDKYGECIRSRQIKILAEAICCGVNEEFARRFHKEAGKTSHNKRVIPCRKKKKRVTA